LNQNVLTFYLVVGVQKRKDQVPNPNDEVKSENDGVKNPNVEVESENDGVKR